MILFGPHNEQMYRVPETGGVATPVETLAAGDTRKNFTRPKFLPDGRHFLLTAAGEPGIYVASLDEPNTRKLMEDGSSPRYAAGYLFYSRGTTLFARPFDPERLRFSGGEIHVTDGAEHRVRFRYRQHCLSSHRARPFNTHMAGPQRAPHRDPG